MTVTLVFQDVSVDLSKKKTLLLFFHTSPVSGHISAIILVYWYIFQHLRKWISSVGCEGFTLYTAASQGGVDW